MELSYANQRHGPNEHQGRMDNSPAVRCLSTVSSFGPDIQLHESLTPLSKDKQTQKILILLLTIQNHAKKTGGKTR
jgi:hypothetical protein